MLQNTDVYWVTVTQDTTCPIHRAASSSVS